MLFVSTDIVIAHNWFVDPEGAKFVLGLRVGLEFDRGDDAQPARARQR